MRANKQRWKRAARFERSPECICVKTIADTLTALHDNDLDLGGVDGAARELAAALDVPFLVVWLASENYMSNHFLLDLDDIEEGLRWIAEHKVPRDLLRLSPSRRQQWEAVTANCTAGASCP